MAEAIALQEDSWQDIVEERARRIREDLEEKLNAQQARRAASEEEVEREGKSGDTSKYWVDKTASGPVVGGQFAPREPYDLMRKGQLRDIDTAYFWGLAHSWLCNFGLTGATAEGEDPRVRCLVTQSTPAVVLFELNSLSTFNMLDPVLGGDIAAMQDAVSDCIIHRSPQNRDHPLGYVLQGVGPHFCPGGNHHPVNPPGGTPFTMSTHVTSMFNVQFREHGIPGICAFSGSNVGGGVAIGTNITQRVAATNASMAFGNLSRGASPLMWLSGNLVAEMGMASAVDIYLTDTTVSAYGALKAGLVMGVASTIPATKSKALNIVRGIASNPAGRLVVHQGIDLNTQRFLMEATGFMFNSKAGSMFANVKKGAAHELAAPMGVKSKRPLQAPDDKRRALRGSEHDEDAEEEARRSASSRQRKERSGRPRPFPDRIAVHPVHVSCCDTPCAQCGSRGTDGTIYGDTYYCEVCWPLLGLDTLASSSAAAAGFSPSSLGGRGEEGATGVWSPTEAAHQVAGSSSRASAVQSGKPPQRTKMSCSSCGAASHSGQWGGGTYASDFYCGGCWKRWRGGGRPHDGGGFHTDVSTTDNDYESGTDATIINSDVASATDGSDVEWW